MGTQHLTTKPYHVTVILNPAAQGGKARSKFENFCEPLLHLAGYKEAVTGMIRRQDSSSFCRNVVLGVLPVGYNNYMAKTLFPYTDSDQSTKVTLTKIYVTESARMYIVFNLQSSLGNSNVNFCF